MKWKHLAWIFPVLLAGVIVVLILTRNRSGDALIYARGTDSTTLDPAEVEYGEDAKVVENLFENLVTFGEDSTAIVPKLATSWTTSPDGKTWTFALRTGITFHDGTPFNAEAVAFTFARLLDEKHPQRPGGGVPYASVFGFIDRVEGTGASVTFHLKQPNPLMLQVLSLFGAGIVSPDAVKKFGEKFSLNPVGTGPYKLAEWRSGEKIVLERYDGYWGAQPPIARVIFIPVANAQTAVEKLKNGEAHIADNITTADISILQSNPDLYVETEVPINVCYLGFNANKPPYNDPNFRKAVSMALDRNELNSLIYYGLGEPARNLVPPVIWGDTGELPPYEYNLDKAREHLAKVTFPPGFEAELWHMTFARPYVPEPHRLAEYIQNQLKKIGLPLKISGFPKGTWEEKTKDPDHPMYILGWNADYADPDNFLHALLHSGGEKGNTLNNSFFRNAEFDDLVTRAQGETDPATRKKLYLRAAEIYREQMPTIALVHVKQLAACSKKVKYNLHPIEVRLFPAQFQK